MKMKGRMALGLLLVALVLHGCGGKDKEDVNGKEVLVMINDDPIKTTDLQFAWNTLPNSQREVYDSPKGVLNLLDELISYRMMAKEAENRKLDQDPVFKKRMELYRERLLVNALIEQSMSDADLMNYFQSNFLRAHFIRSAFGPDAKADEKTKARAKAEQALAALKAPGANFDSIMQMYSDPRGEGDNGDMGYVTHQTIENMTNFAGADELFNLKEPGEITGIIEGKDGWYIFTLVEPPGKLDVNGLTPELTAGIRDERRTEVIRSMASELRSRDDFKVVRNQANIAELMKTLEQQWGTRPGSTVEPGAGSTAAPTSPAPAAPTAPATAPASTATGAPAGATVPAAPAPTPAPAAPSAPPPPTAAPAPAAPAPAPAPSGGGTPKAP